MKLATSLTQTLGITDPFNFITCGDLNELAFTFAQAKVSEKALARYNSRGRTLKFEADIEQQWNSGWEDEDGIFYTFYDDNSVGVASWSVIMDNDFVPAEDAGMHYCDLFTPYRALEWIYATGLRHAPHS